MEPMGHPTVHTHEMRYGFYRLMLGIAHVRQCASLHAEGGNVWWAITWELARDILFSDGMSHIYEVPESVR